jgi:hypothetical protein
MYSSNILSEDNFEGCYAVVLQPRKCKQPASLKRQCQPTVLHGVKIQRAIVWTIVSSKAGKRIFCKHWNAGVVLQSLQKPAFHVKSVHFKNHPCPNPILSSPSLCFKRFPHQNSACVRRDGRASHTLSARDICLSIPLPVNIARATFSTRIGNLMTELELCTVWWSAY